MSLDIIILAAGKGSRMKSAIPKVLHKIAGKALLEHVMHTSQSLLPDNIYIVYGYQGEQLQQYFQNTPYFNQLVWVEQKEQLGTAHAVRQVLNDLKNCKNMNYINQKILILYGDAPLISCKTLKNFIDHTGLDQLGILTATLDQPQGFGRIIRDSQHKIIGIIEEKDANSQQRNISEINTGIYLASLENLQKWLPKINKNNHQQEYYLTDIFNPDIHQNTEIISMNVDQVNEIQGVNNRVELHQLERYYQQQQAQKLMQNGVTVMDAERLDMRGSINLDLINSDVILDINLILEDSISIGSGSKIGANCILKNVVIGKNVDIKSHCVIEDAAIGDDCQIGPFARIRPNTVLSEKASIGNFVEIKNSKIGKGSKISHLSYVGDTLMGEQVNVGAGTITCNYDGVHKHQTVIGNHVFIGSDSQLIAPVHIEDGAFIGAGSTITKTAPSDKLTLSRSKQQTIHQWVRPEKKPEK